jgi:hypothetical protein
MLGLFRVSLCGVLVNTAPDVQCFFLDFGHAHSAELEWNGLIFSTGRYPLQLSLCFGVAGLTASEEHGLKYSVPAEIGSSSWIVSD